tara:strand:+ start:308 stop:430 length:123 start_codon:yes stop_codon:yes gene_type:complete
MIAEKSCYKKLLKKVAEKVAIKITIKRSPGSSKQIYIIVN